MKNNKRKVILGSIIGGLIGTLMSVSYAFFTYTKTGTSNNQLVTGDIYMRYRESTTTINIHDMMPRSTKPSDYFEFTVEGTNTTENKDIIYDINILHGDDYDDGDNDDTNDKVRIRDEFLRFTLEADLEDGQGMHEIISNKKYSDFSNGLRIWVYQINKNTTEKVTHTYRLYVWIDESVKIGNNDQDYTMSEWNNLFASVKVNVTGDFNEKSIYPKLYDVVKTNAIVDNNIDGNGTSIKFYQINGTSNGNGKFVRSTTVDDEYPIYYYRGNVDNNNLLFANICWKIVRTTETGGIKLIYNGRYTIENKCNNDGTLSILPELEKFNINSNSPAYVGYSYGEVYEILSVGKNGAFGNTVQYEDELYKLNNTRTGADNTHHYTCDTNCNKVRYYHFANNGYNHYITLSNGETIETALNNMLFQSLDTNKSNIQVAINNWYDNFIKNKYDQYIEDTQWCSDRSISSTYNLMGWNFNGGSLKGTMWFDVAERITNKNESIFPKLTCDNVNDRLTYTNGKIGSKSALLTIDEMAIAGLVLSSPNYDNYLYINNDYWLLSPMCGSKSGINQTVAIVKSNGSLGEENVDSKLGLRPSLSLTKNAVILNGNGTKTDPYVITEYMVS